MEISSSSSTNIVSTNSDLELDNLHEDSSSSNIVPAKSDLKSDNLDENSSSSDIVSTNNDLKLDTVHEDIHHFYLFKYLHIKDVLKLKSVNKKLYSIVNSYNIKELFFLDFSYLDADEIDKNEYTRQEKCGKVNNILNYSKLDLLINSSDNLLNLKSLRISGYICVQEIEQFNKLTKLQKLNIDCVYFPDYFGDVFYKEENYRLNLPALKELEISLYGGFCFAGTISLMITAPNLQILDLFCGKESCELEHPLSIKYLKLCRDYLRLTKFTNLESLEIYVCNSLLKKLTRLSDLKNLKKLKITFIKNKYLQETISKLKELFQSNEGPKFEIVLHGVKIKRIDKLDEYRGENDLKFQLNNYGDLDDDLDFVQTINYNELIRLLPKLPSDLFSKFQINQLKIDSSVKDESKLIDFIKKCKKLYALKIEDASLSQKFYDSLPSISLLSYLEIVEFKVDIDFKFTKKMPHLINLCDYINIEEDLNDSDNQDVSMNEN